MKIIIICQARTGSKRFPNKILANFRGRKVINYLIDLAAELPFEFIFAIPENDKSLENYLFNEGALIFLGSELDVLDRYYQCALEYQPDVIIRIGADTPILQTADIYLALGLFLKQGNYFGTKLVDVFSFAELQEAWSHANKPEQREHVTPFMVPSIEYEEDLDRWK